MDENINQELLKNTRVLYKNSNTGSFIAEYNEFGLETYYKVINNGFESIKKYNENGQLVYRKDSDGFQIWVEYDEKGREIYNRKEIDHKSWVKFNGNHPNTEYEYRKMNGFEERFTYNEQGLLSYSKTTNGLEKWYKYNEKGLLISETHSDGYCHHIEYDERGRNISSIISRVDKSEKVIFIYNDKDLMIESIDENGKTIYEYDEKGLLILVRYPDGYTTKSNYDEKGREIYRGIFGEYILEIWYEYDEKDRLIHRKDSDGFESWYEYEEIK